MASWWIDFFDALAKISDSFSYPFYPLIKPALAATLTALVIHLVIDRILSRKETNNEVPI